MKPTLPTAVVAALASSFVTTATQAQSRTVSACALLSSAEVAKIVGRRSYVDGLARPLAGNGSQCSYDVGASLTLYSGPTAAAMYEALGTTGRGASPPRQPVAGFGDSAYVAVLPGDEYPGQYARLLLVVRQGMHAASLTANVPEGQKSEGVQPQVLAMAKAVLPRLPK